MSKPEVFIVESLTFDDESKGRFEGRILSQLLALSQKACEYRYIRTKRELEVVLREFSLSRYRYLHLSCHGDDSSMSTTLDTVPFSEFGPLVAPHLQKGKAES
jgi:hypothetical protein